MGVPNDMKYPKLGTKAEWDKGKTLADKASKKTKHTGLGPVLLAAEKAWNDIPFAELVVAPAKINTLALARAALKRADEIINGANGPVDKAWIALRKAKDVAEDTKNNKDLSKASVKAATAAHGAIVSLMMRRGDFTTDDFENLVEVYEKKEREAYVRQSGMLTEVVIKAGTTEVATASAGVWNKIKLKTSGTAWKSGHKAKAYIGKKLTVTARQGGDDHKVETISGQTNKPEAKFINDLILESADGSATVFKKP